MDKYEYNLKLDEMKSLVMEGRYQAAAEIADTINWRKIKNVTALVRAGEIYENVERLNEAKEIFQMAYGRSPIGRTIVYRLACLAIKMVDFDAAREYYNEFVAIAPHDILKYVLKYELNKAQGSDYATLIQNLVDLKEQEFSEEWGYELAYLYHQAGMSEKCIEICDEIILYFGDGAYVERALELKMLYQPLSPVQEEIYRKIRFKKEGLVEVTPDDVLESGEIITETIKIPEVKLSPERFNTQNLQEALQKSMQQIVEATETETVEDTREEIKKLVEEIPVLQIPVEKAEAKEENLKESIPTDKEIDDSLKQNFEEMLNEEFDDKKSSDGELHDSQAHGQSGIEDALNDWEKTRRAAAIALHEAEQQKLEAAKARALQEAEDIMERLADVIPKLDSGITPQQLLKEQYLNGSAMTEERAVKMVSDMNELLQKEIDRLNTENARMDEELAIVQEHLAEKELITEKPVVSNKDDGISEEIIEKEESIAEIIETEVELTSYKEEVEDDFSEEIAKSLAYLERRIIQEQTEEQEVVSQLENLPETELPKESVSLTEEEKELFTYFIPVKGMEDQICIALGGITNRLQQGLSGKVGNLIIEGGTGNGKTVLAIDFVKALQQKIGKPEGKVGKIDAEVLNKKDINVLFPKIAGGCLIIEGAGKLKKSMVVSLASLLEQDTKGTLIILEDTKYGIENLLVRDSSFASRFSEKISIPIFSNDELVVFARAYAAECGYVIDEMATLALYNCISNIQNLDHETTVAEVKEIVDNAIEHAEKGAIRKAFKILAGSRYDEDNYVILREKDFNN